MFGGKGAQHGVSQKVLKTWEKENSSQSYMKPKFREIGRFEGEMENMTCRPDIVNELQLNLYMLYKKEVCQS